ncbi:MAG: 3-phosphoserine/phosphohydroxythreonine transaminase [Vulcanimicrobiota bacterium]
MTTAQAQKRIYNFSAGPAVLPVSVLQEVKDEMMCLPGAGASVLEISHRSKNFEEIIEGARQNIRDLLDLPEGYHVLFLQGGATTQFSMIPMNFHHSEGRAHYVRCGAWANKAIKEAKKVGPVDILWDGESGGYKEMPTAEVFEKVSGGSYAHTTSNETIEGVEFPYDPSTGSVPLVCDASSDFLHRKLDVKNYSLIYAGAQKNVGPAGATIVILKDEFLQKQVGKSLPTMLDYKLMVAGESMHNTPPAFSIYVIEKVTRWLKEEIGGLDAIYERNRKKAKVLYDAIDASEGYYRGHAKPEFRSLMNVTFRLPSEELEKKFIKEATAADFDGLKGHRAVGGLRASIYNAFPPEGVDALVEFMKEFQKNNG